ncbi:MAG: Mur ligase family protein [Anaerovoracaceae bacterium]|jgi:UDP-N-acetylmuramyl-tripeptide synthetase
MSMRRYTLEQYIQLLDDHRLIQFVQADQDALKREVEYLSYDSREMKPGGLFICKGAHFLPRYLQDAVDRGAFCYISEAEYDLPRKDVGMILVTDIRKAMALLANLFYNEAWKQLKLIGITGTKGKSTTTYYVKHILDHYLAAAGKPPCAILSGIDVDDGVISEESHLTTPEAVMLHRHFRNAVDSGRGYLAMEVSSQALKYDRTEGVLFDVGCYLNVGEDHISPIEHCDFDDYFESKLKLFTQCRIACINMDADHVREVCDSVDPSSKIITFGTNDKADIYGHRIISREDGIDFEVRTPTFTRNFKLGMTGLFNVENALAAIAVCYALDIPEDSMYHGLAAARVPGRMELFMGKESGALVIVDYAHNRMSFDRLFRSTIKEYPKRHIIAVFGCPGKKALARRQELAEIAGRYSEKVYITEEDAGEEDVMSICREIAGHLKKTGCAYEIEPDRGEAIRKAIGEADENTVILLTGKGRETRQKRGVEYIDCPSDVEYVLQYLK